MNSLPHTSANGYKPFKSVADSGLAWLGNVPLHWQLRRFGYFFKERREKVSDKDYAPLSVTKSGIVPQLDTAAKTDDGDNRKRVCAGDFVINSRSDRKGSSGISPLNGSVSLICTVLEPQERIAPAFVHYLLRSEPFQDEFYRYGKGIVADLWSTNYSEMRNITLAMPPYDEQWCIATFLDRETAKIDALVAEQRRLIELLKEKRQAVISHAVTKGLNPTSPLKPSGIDWLGDVPAHWSVKRLKQVSPQITVGIVVEPSKYYVLQGVPALRSMNVRPGQIVHENMVYLSKEANDLHQKSKIWEGDIVAVRSGQPGTAATVPALLNGANCVDLIIIRKPSTGSERFLCWFLAGDLALRQFSSGSEGAIQQHFNVGTASNLIVTVPPPDEQDEIAAFVDEETLKVDSLITQATYAVELLLERRSALISASVTGQIDVRNLDRELVTA